MADRILPAIRRRLPNQSKRRIQAGIRQQEPAPGLGSRKTSLCVQNRSPFWGLPFSAPSPCSVPFSSGVGQAVNLTVGYLHLKSAFVLPYPWLTLQRMAEAVHKGRAGGCYRVLGFSPTWSGTTLHRFSGLCLEPFVEKEITVHKSLVPALERK